MSSVWKTEDVMVQEGTRSGENEIMYILDLVAELESLFGKVKKKMYYMFNAWLLTWSYLSWKGQYDVWKNNYGEIKVRFCLFSPHKIMTLSELTLPTTRFPRYSPPLFSHSAASFLRTCTLQPIHSFLCKQLNEVNSLSCQRVSRNSAPVVALIGQSYSWEVWGQSPDTPRLQLF